MKRLFAFMLFAATVLCTVQAQTAIRYGTIAYDSLLQAMPEYTTAKAQLATLRDKYEAEARYNETNFRRLFADFLEGQKDFPQNIMLKRQRDLQNEMERALAYRAEGDSLLRVAERELLAPVRARLNEAVRGVGLERGYECIVDRQRPGLPFLHPAVCEAADRYVSAKLLQVAP